MTPRNPTTNPELQALVTRLADDLRVDVCSLYKLAPDGQHLVLVATQGLLPLALGYRMPLTSGLTGRVARSRKVVAVKDPQNHPDYHHVLGSGEERFKTFLGIPVQRGGRLLGVLVVQTVHPHLYLLQEVSRIHATGRDVEPWLVAA
jgi:phosphotransferase system enzyme I (PtsP)